MKRKLLLLGFVLCTTLSFVACGKKEEVEKEEVIEVETVLEKTEGKVDKEEPKKESIVKKDNAKEEEVSQETTTETSEDLDNFIIPKDKAMHFSLRTQVDNSVIEISGMSIINEESKQAYSKTNIGGIEMVTYTDEEDNYFYLDDSAMFSKMLLESELLEQSTLRNEGTLEGDLGSFLDKIMGANTNKKSESLKISPTLVAYANNEELDLLQQDGVTVEVEDFDTSDAQNILNGYSALNGEVVEENDKTITILYEMNYEGVPSDIIFTLDKETNTICSLSVKNTTKPEGTTIYENMVEITFDDTSLDDVDLSWVTKDSQCTVRELMERYMSSIMMYTFETIGYN